MNNNDFRKHGHDLIDWMADYFEHVDRLPVKSKVNPAKYLIKFLMMPQLIRSPSNA